MTRARASAVRPAAGFSLIEVLVSMCIVSMGILALVALTQAAARGGRMSGFRATATLLASDIADRVRANRAGAALGPAGYDLPAQGWSALPASSSGSSGACTRLAPCQPAELARADLAAWTARIRATLPNGSAALKYHAATAAAGESVDVWVGWSESGLRAAGALPERGTAECPSAWRDAGPAIRCVGLQVSL